MEDAIEICAGCGKMPRPIDSMGGSFRCSRCGNQTTMQVTTENYEKVVMELDRQFQERLLKQKVQAAASAPVEMKPRKTKKAPPKAKKAAKRASRKAKKK